MEFFVPSVSGQEAAENFLRSLKSFANDATGWEVIPGRARSIAFHNELGLQTATVGREVEEETVECILNSDKMMMICTVNHGMGWGSPILVDKLYIEKIEWFEGCGPDEDAVRLNQACAAA